MLKLNMAAAATLILASLALAQSDSLSKTVGGVTFYLGVIPAEIVRAHPIEHPESTMHGSPPKGSGSRHIVVALFDAATGARITDAKVSARVEQLELAAELKDLEPMQISGTVSYGNFYAMPGNGIYRIRIVAKRKGLRVPSKPSSSTGLNQLTGHAPGQGQGSWRRMHWHRGSDGAAIVA